MLFFVYVFVVVFVYICHISDGTSNHIALNTIHISYTYGARSHLFITSILFSALLSTKCHADLKENIDSRIASYQTIAIDDDDDDHTREA
jgi:hypothetical protein